MIKTSGLIAAVLSALFLGCHRGGPNGTTDQPAPIAASNGAQAQLLTDLGARLELSGPRDGSAIVGVDLSNTSIVDDDLDALAALGQLRNLSLKNCRITDGGLGHLSALKGLRRLDLSGTGVTGTGLRRLASLGELEELSLPSGTSVNALELLPHLKRLNMGDTNTYQLKPLAKLRELEELTLGQANTDAMQVPKGLSHLKRLDMGLAGSFTALANLTALEDLTIMSPIDDQTMRTITTLGNIRRLKLLQPRVSDARLAELASMRSLRTLELQDTLIDDEGLKCLGKLKNLRSLSFTSSRITDDGLRHLAALTDLEELQLGYTVPSDDGMAHLAKLTHLRRLSLSSPIKGAGTVHLAQMPDLQELDLPCGHIDDAGLAALSKTARLQILRADGSPVTPAGFKSLGRLHQLCELVLRNASITGEGMAQLAALSNLRKLDLTNCRFAGGLKNLPPDLVSLRLDSSSVTDKDVPDLAHLRRLQRLMVRQTGLTGKGFAALAGLTQLRELEIGSVVNDTGAQELSQLSQLRRLSLWYNEHLTDASLPWIARLQKLQTLDLTRTHVTNEGMKELARMGQLGTLSVDGTSVTPSAMEHLGQAPRLRYTDLGMEKAWLPPAKNTGVAVVSADKTLSFRLLTPRKTCDAAEPIVLIAELRNISGRKMTVIAPLADHYAAEARVRITGPRGVVRYQPGASPTYAITFTPSVLAPGEAIRGMVSLPLTSFPGSDTPGDYEITFTYKTDQYDVGHAGRYKDLRFHKLSDEESKSIWTGEIAGAKVRLTRSQ